MTDGVHTMGKASCLGASMHSPRERCPNIMDTWALILEGELMSQK